MIVVIESMRATLRPLLLFAAGMLLVMALPDGVPAATAAPLDADAPATARRLPATTEDAAAPALGNADAVHILTLVFDPNRLPASAFGDIEEVAR